MNMAEFVKQAKEIMGQGNSILKSLEERLM